MAVKVGIAASDGYNKDYDMSFDDAIDTMIKNSKDRIEFLDVNINAL